MKKILILVITLMLILLTVVVTTAYTNLHLFRPKIIDVDIGENLEGISIYDYKGNQFDLNSIKNKNTAVFYLSDSCQACVDKLYVIDRIIDIFKSEEIDFLLLWENTIPEKRIRKATIEMSRNYYVKDIALSRIRPYNFILDKEGKISFCSYDYKKLINKLFSDIKDTKNLKGKALEYILESNSINKSKKNALFFSSDFCEECVEIQKRIDQNKQLKEEGKIFKMRVENETAVSSLDPLWEPDIDYFGLYAKVFGISKTPTFFISTQDNSFVETDQYEEILKLIKE